VLEACVVVFQGGEVDASVFGAINVELCDKVVQFVCESVESIR
jgi:hypothetical protein